VNHSAEELLTIVGVIFTIAVIFVLVFLGQGWWQGRGVAVVSAACQADGRRYTLDVTVRNTRPEPTLAVLRIQRRLRAPAGRTWPDANTRAHDEQVSDVTTVPLGPEEEQRLTQLTEAAVADFNCETIVWQGAHQRLGR
jgi:hypothetical protein